jgi:hypothetical protein
MYSQITYTIGNITKTPYFGITVLAGYMFVLPTFGKYDLKNIVNHFAEKAFDYFGVLSKPQPFPGVSSTYGVGIFCVLFFLCLSCNYFITKKRTAFV